MTLYNCSNCGGVHDSADPGCPNAIGCHITFGIGNKHPDLQALIELKEAAMEWFRNDDEFFRLLRSGDRGEDFVFVRERIGTLYDRMLRLARRWDPLPNIPGPEGEP